jgi:hypothetical protein
MDWREVDGAALEAGTEAQVSLYPAATAGPATLTSQPVQPHLSPAHQTNIFLFARGFLFQEKLPAKRITKFCLFFAKIREC